MFIDSFTLNKNAWYSKLMKYIWKLYPQDFTHICPFFWLTLLNILIFPFVFLFKTILGTILYKIADLIEKRIEKIREQNAKELKEMLNLIKQKPELQEEYSKKYAIYEDSGFSYKRLKCFSKLDRKIIESIYYDNKYDNYIDIKILNKYYKAYTNNKVVKPKLTINPNKELINKLNKIAKPIGQLLLLVLFSILLFIIGLYLYKFIVFLSNLNFTFNYKKFIHVLKVIGIIILGIVATIAIVYYLEKLIKDTKFLCYLVKFLSIVAKPFIWIGIGLWKIGIVIFQMLKSNCPAIKWENK